MFKVSFNASQLNINESFIGVFENLTNSEPTRLIHDKSLPIPHKFLNRIAYLESKKQFLITDREDKTIKILSNNGTYLGEYNPNLMLEYPFAIYVNNYTNEIFVGDYKKQCVFVFDENFNYITEFGNDIAKAPNTITMDRLTNLIYCTDYWYDRVTIWKGDRTTASNLHSNKYSLHREFHCDSPAYVQVAEDKIFIVSAVELETDESNVKVKDIKKGSNCIFVIDKLKHECLFEIRLKNWIEPYGLFVDSKMNIYTSASELDNESNISITAFLFKFDMNGRLITKIPFSNYVPIDFYIIDDKVLSISTETSPVQVDLLKE